MPKTLLLPREALYPVPVVLVTSLDPATEQANIITIAWCGIVCSEPPQVSISIRPHRHSHGVIAKTKEFVINIPSASHLIETDRCGVRSGKDTDKFTLCGFTKEPASKVKAPLIKECPVNIECALRSTMRLGVHDLFIGEVVAVHADSSIRRGDGSIDFAKAAPIVFNQGEYWNLGKKIGFYGCSTKR